MISVTIAIYALARELGPEAAMAEFRRQLANPTDPDSLACTRALARLKHIDNLSLHVDAGGSATAKMRSRAAYAAFISAADTWVSIDDDVEATFETLQAMVEATRAPGMRVVVAPCFLRRGDDDVAPIVNVAFEPTAEQQARALESGAKLWPAIAGGFGLVAMSRATLEHALTANTHLAYRDDDGVQRVGLFHEDLAEGRWWGEDLSFFRHLPPDVSVEVLASGHTSHAGMVLDCSTLGHHTRMRLEGFRVVHEGILEERPRPPPGPEVLVSASPVAQEAPPPG